MGRHVEVVKIDFLHREPGVGDTGYGLYDPAVGIFPVILGSEDAAFWAAGELDRQRGAWETVPHLAIGIARALVIQLPGKVAEDFDFDIPTGCPKAEQKGQCSSCQFLHRDERMSPKFRCSLYSYVPDVIKAIEACRDA